MSFIFQLEYSNIFFPNAKQRFKSDKPRSCPNSCQLVTQLRDKFSLLGRCKSIQWLSRLYRQVPV